MSGPVTGSSRISGGAEPETLPPLRAGFCDTCNQGLPQGSRADQRFCSPACRKAWWVKARNRGAQLYQWAMLWRAFRGRAGTPGAGMLSHLARKVDEWRQQDRKDIS